MQPAEQIVQAVKDGDAPLVRDLVRKDPRLASARDEKGVSVVMQAVYYRRNEVLSILLATNPPLDLFEAAALGKRELMAMLVDEDPAEIAACSPDGFTPLHLSCFFGHYHCSQLLIRGAADVNAIADNPMAVAPIHSAAAGRNLDIVKLLLDNGACVNARQHGGWTALHAAAMNGDQAMVDALLEAGADAGLKSDDGKTAADMAVGRVANL
ncbi:MAG: ankyrin repeat domain-containing protein [Bryobacterales bacterium]|nr:ankyrin repeat domain-containing protein [Bryobacterales bacterium]